MKKGAMRAASFNSGLHDECDVMGIAPATKVLPEDACSDSRQLTAARMASRRMAMEYDTTDKLP
jgi:hypothetical protein